MPEQVHVKPVEELKGAVQQAAIAEVTSRPRRERRTYLFELGLLAVIGAFTTLTILSRSIPFFPIDVQITHALQSMDSPLLLTFMNVISWPGFLPQCFIACVLIALALYGFGFQWESLAAVFAALLPPIANVIVKESIQRPRPTTDLVDVFRLLDSYSFPSGHVMFYVGFFGFIWFLGYTLLKPSALRTSLLTLMGIWIALIGTSRIYLGQHWASDVVGAYLLGSLTLVVHVKFYRWGKKRFFIHQPAAPEKPVQQIPDG